METLSSKSIEMYTTLPMSERPFNLCMRRLENKGYVVPVYFRVYKKKPHIRPAHLLNAIVDEPINYTLTSEGKAYLSKVRSEQQSKSPVKQTDNRVKFNKFIDSFIRASTALSNYRLDGSQEYLDEAEFQLKEIQAHAADAGVDVIFSINKDLGMVSCAISERQRTGNSARNI
jgi:hypothetical protein